MLQLALCVLSIERNSFTETNNRDSIIFFHRGEVIRLALCLRKNTTQFKIKSDFLDINTNNGNILWVNSVAEVDTDTTMKAYFWDQANG